MVRTGPTVVSMEGLRGKIDGVVELLVFGVITVRGMVLGIPLPEVLVLRVGIVGIVCIVRTGPVLVPEGGSTVRGMLEGTPPPLMVRTTGLSSRGISEGMPLRGMVGTTGDVADERMMRGAAAGMPLRPGLTRVGLG